jgi:hypothetical protein
MIAFRLTLGFSSKNCLLTPPSLTCALRIYQRHGSYRSLDCKTSPSSSDSAAAGKVSKLGRDNSPWYCLSSGAHFVCLPDRLPSLITMLGWHLAAAWVHPPVSEADLLSQFRTAFGRHLSKNAIFAFLRTLVLRRTESHIYFIPLIFRTRISSH